MIRNKLSWGHSLPRLDRVFVPEATGYRTHKCNRPRPKISWWWMKLLVSEVFKNTISLLMGFKIGIHFFPLWDLRVPQNTGFGLVNSLMKENELMTMFPDSYKQFEVWKMFILMNQLPSCVPMAAMLCNRHQSFLHNFPIRTTDAPYQFKQWLIEL